MAEQRIIQVEVYGNEEELAKHLPDLSNADAETLAITIAKVLNQHHAKHVVILDVRGKSDIADYFVLATGNTSSQVLSYANDVEDMIIRKGEHVLSRSGGGSKEWNVLDYGNVIVHIFNREAREYYKLEKLYADVDQIILEEVGKE